MWRPVQEGTMRKTTQVVAMILLAAAVCWGQEGEKVGRAEVTEEEKAVYAAVIGQLAANGDVKQALISDTTSTFACGTSCNGMLEGKCSGMRQEDQTPEQAVDALKEKW